MATMDDDEHPGPPRLTEEDLAQARPLFDSPTTDEERPQGPPPMAEGDLVPEPASSDFGPPGATTTEGLELDRSNFEPLGLPTYEAPSPSKPPAADVVPAKEIAKRAASDVARLLGSSAALLLALVVCLLPAYWRERIRRHLADLPLRLAAVITGIAEMAAAFLFGLESMLRFMNAQLEEIGPVMMNHVLKHDVPPQTMFEMHQLQGAVLWITFLVSPTGLLLAFFMLEGATRIVGTAVVKEPWGILALWLVEQVRRLTGGLIRRSQQEVLPADKIAKDGQGILVSIESAQSYAWDHTTTLSFEARFYVVEEWSSTGDNERPYLYRIREAPRGHLIRRVTEYRPTP